MRNGCLYQILFTIMAGGIQARGDNITKHTHLSTCQLHLAQKSNMILFDGCHRKDSVDKPIEISTTNAQTLRPLGEYASDVV
jgi:hypothetical protein